MDTIILVESWSKNLLVPKIDMALSFPSHKKGSTGCFSLYGMTVGLEGVETSCWGGARVGGMLEGSLWGILEWVLKLKVGMLTSLILPEGAVRVASTWSAQGGFFSESMSMLFSFSTLLQYSVVEAETADIRNKVESSQD